MKGILKNCVSTGTAVALLAMPVLPIAAPVAGAVNAGLVSCWSLEEGGEPWLDAVDSNNLNHVAPFPMPNQVAGKIGFGLQMPVGSISIAQSDGSFNWSGAWSLSFWVEHEANPNDRVILDDSDANIYFGWIPSSNHFGLGVNSGSMNQYIGTENAPLGAYHHVVITSDGATTKVYVNGVLDITAPDSGNTVSGKLRMYNASFDEVGFYAGMAISAADVALLYNGGSGVACAGFPTPTPAPTSTPTPSITPTPTPTTTPPPGCTTYTGTQNGKLKLKQGGCALLQGGATLHGGISGGAGTTVWIVDAVQIDGSVQDIANLHLATGAVMNVTGGLSVTGSLVIDQDAVLAVGGKFTCTGATVTNNGSFTIGNNQCGALTAARGTSMSLALAGLLASLGAAFYLRGKR